MKFVRETLGGESSDTDFNQMLQDKNLQISTFHIVIMTGTLIFIETLRVLSSFTMTTRPLRISISADSTVPIKICAVDICQIDRFLKRY